MFCYDPSVKGRNAYDVVYADWQKVQDDARAAALGCEAVLDAAKDAHQKLLNHTKEIDGWPGPDFARRRQGAEEDLKEFAHKFSVLLDYHASILIAVEKKKKDNAQGESADSRPNQGECG